MCAQYSGDSWRQFRGNLDDGRAPLARFPIQWSPTSGLRWRTTIHGRGWSSPVVDGNEIWLTTATEDGLKMHVVCVALDSGAIVHDRLIFENEVVQPDYHITNSYASPTPVLDDQHIYVHFGAYGTACLRRSDFSLRWQRRDLPCNHYRGPGSSPILYRDLLIFHMDGFDYQYAIALDRVSGQTVWKADRQVEYGTDNGDYYKAFSTPRVIQLDGHDQLISPASMACLALDPLTGKELWRVRYEEHSTTVRPLFDGQFLYLSTGFSKPKLLCVRADGSGDVTDSHIVWSQHKSIGSKPSPVLVNGKLFVVSDDGVISRLDVQTGEIRWQQRLGGKFSASLVATDQHVIAVDHDGAGYVFTVADQPQLVGENRLDEGCNASPALLRDSLILRTTSQLVRIAQ
ncbi:MAG: PQQ-binding-like beta-propeller repeat protein [Pirellulaceae bacterium]|nr:PQQ-binding-like beta-propeller repeat protein [Pirellulaceae bacterium]